MDRISGAANILNKSIPRGSEESRVAQSLTFACDGLLTQYGRFSETWAENMITMQLKGSCNGIQDNEAPVMVWLNEYTEEEVEALYKKAYEQSS